MIQRKKKIKQDGKILTEKNTFLKSYFHWQGRNFITNKKMSLSSLKPHNFAHVLSKGNYKWFKFYFGNIVILDLDQHFLFDNFTEEKLQSRKKKHPEEDWDKLFNYETKMIQEYAIHCENNPRIYKQ